jgi:hypothetical protein
VHSKEGGKEFWGHATGVVLAGGGRALAFDDFSCEANRLLDPGGRHWQRLIGSEQRGTVSDFEIIGVFEPLTNDHRSSPLFNPNICAFCNSASPNAKSKTYHPSHAVPTLTECVTTECTVALHTDCFPDKSKRCPFCVLQTIFTTPPAEGSDERDKVALAVNGAFCVDGYYEPIVSEVDSSATTQAPKQLGGSSNCGPTVLDYCAKYLVPSGDVKFGSFRLEQNVSMSDLVKVVHGIDGLCCQLNVLDTAGVVLHPGGDLFGQDQHFRYILEAVRTLAQKAAVVILGSSARWGANKASHFVAVTGAQHLFDPFDGQVYNAVSASLELVLRDDVKMTTLVIWAKNDPPAVLKTDAQGGPFGCYLSPSHPSACQVMQKEDAALEALCCTECGNQQEDIVRCEACAFGCVCPPGSDCANDRALDFQSAYLSKWTLCKLCEFKREALYTSRSSCANCTGQIQTLVQDHLRTMSVLTRFNTEGDGVVEAAKLQRLLSDLLGQCHFCPGRRVKVSPKTLATTTLMKHWRNDNIVSEAD